MKRIISTLLFMVACAPGGSADDPPVFPNTSSTSGVDGSSESTGFDDESSSGGLESSSEESSSTGEPLCEPTQDPAGAYEHCGSYCEGECADGRRCVNAPGDFETASCTYECTSDVQCDTLEGSPDPICQLGFCGIPCDEQLCPSGMECFTPQDSGIVRPVCLAVKQ